MRSVVPAIPAGTEQRHPPRHLRLDIIDRAELAGRGLRPDDVLHRQADAQHACGHAGDLGETRVPFDQPQIAVDHRHAVRHAGERRLQLDGLVVRHRLGQFQLGVGGGQHGAVAAERRLAPMRGPQCEQQDGRQGQQREGNDTGEQIGGDGPGLCARHRLRQVHPDDNRKIGVRDAVEGMHALDAVERRPADPHSIGVGLERLEHRRIGDAGSRFGHVRPRRHAQLRLSQPHHGDHAVAADIRHPVEPGDALEPQRRTDDPGE